MFKRLNSTLQNEAEMHTCIRDSLTGLGKSYGTQMAIHKACESLIKFGIYHIYYKKNFYLFLFQQDFWVCIQMTLERTIFNSPQSILLHPQYPFRR